MPNPKGSLIIAISKEIIYILGWLGVDLVGYPDLDGEVPVLGIKHAMSTIRNSEDNLCLAIERDFARVRNE